MAVEPGGLGEGGWTGGVCGGDEGGGQEDIQYISIIYAIVYNFLNCRKEKYFDRYYTISFCC